MKRLILTLILLSLALPSFADASIQELLVRRQGSNVNVRVTVTNLGRTTQAGPVVVELYARENESATWQKITTFNNIAKIARNNRVARDYFDENNAVLKDLASKGAFEVRATVNAPGMTAAAEKISFYNTDTGK